jgi:hypothetical protein
MIRIIQVNEWSYSKDLGTKILGWIPSNVSIAQMKWMFPIYLSIPSAVNKNQIFSNYKYIWVFIFQHCP